ncbi:MAG: hypothetical protein K5872_06030 [Rhizobiaceae bacterium]|nr:hypothetical protein [Rhizobiaceae bacterium]MCV0405771.1 hypothetical protein [Rhizobiaceae bacterium]
MATVTVRKLPEEVVRELRISAAKRGVSMEQEARDRLGQPLAAAREAASNATEWKLKASLEEMLALGQKPDQPVDHKAESDALYDYLHNE